MKNMNLISTRTHGLIDYLTIWTFLTLPRLLGWNKELTNAMTMVALGKLGYTLFTRHELGAVKAIPMKAHLALDAMGGAAVCALPFLTDEDDMTATVVCASLGLFDIGAATTTETEASFDKNGGNGGGRKKALRGRNRKSQGRRSTAGAMMDSKNHTGRRDPAGSTL